MRLILDTKVFISGVLFTGPPLRILEAWRKRRVEMLMSPEILQEYSEVGERLRLQHPDVDLTPVLAMVVLKATVIHARALPERVCADPDDDKFLACAVSGPSWRLRSSC